jgi:uncharacterized membrane protein
MNAKIVSALGALFIGGVPLLNTYDALKVNDLPPVASWYTPNHIKPPVCGFVIASRVLLPPSVTRV